MLGGVAAGRVRLRRKRGGGRSPRALEREDGERGEKHRSGSREGRRGGAGPARLSRERAPDRRGARDECSRERKRSDRQGKLQQEADDERRLERGSDREVTRGREALDVLLDDEDERRNERAEPGEAELAAVSSARADGA